MIVVADGFDKDGNLIYKKLEFSKELKELIKERDLNIKDKAIKRPHHNYNTETGKAETTFK